MSSSIDPVRAAQVQRRVDAAWETIRYHEREATDARIRAAVLVRTWGLCPHSAGQCCNNPSNCVLDNGGPTR